MHLVYFLAGCRSPGRGRVIIYALSLIYGGLKLESISVEVFNTSSMPACDSSSRDHCISQAGAPKAWFMTMPKFSIVIPTYNRADGRLQRALRSVETQQSWRADKRFDYEVIVVDDGSTDATPDLIWFSDAWAGCFRYIYHVRQGRVVARNNGMRAASGEWICWLDSDDGYDPMYLATFAHYIEQQPEARLWVCGAIVHGVLKDEDGKHLVPKWTKIRPAWSPPVDDDGMHDHFNSGRVGTGMFVFHQECLEKTGLMPPWKNCYEIADGCNEYLGYETGYSSKTRLCGNPNGEDWVFFRRLTQFYRVYLIKAALYVQYVR